MSFPNGNGNNYQLPARNGSLRVVNNTRPPTDNTDKQQKRVTNSSFYPGNHPTRYETPAPPEAQLVHGVYAMGISQHQQHHMLPPPQNPYYHQRPVAIFQPPPQPHYNQYHYQQVSYHHQNQYYRPPVHVQQVYFQQARQPQYYPQNAYNHYSSAPELSSMSSSPMTSSTSDTSPSKSTSFIPAAHYATEQLESIEENQVSDPKEPVIRANSTDSTQVPMRRASLMGLRKFVTLDERSSIPARSTSTARIGAQELVDQGASAFYRRRYQEAATRWSHLVERGSFYALVALGNLGCVYLKRCQLALAKEHFNNAYVKTVTATIESMQKPNKFLNVIKKTVDMSQIVGQSTSASRKGSESSINTKESTDNDPMRGPPLIILYCNLLNNLCNVHSMSKNYAQALKNIDLVIQITDVAFNDFCLPIGLHLPESNVEITVLEMIQISRNRKESFKVKFSWFHKQLIISKVMAFCNRGLLNTTIGNFDRAQSDFQQAFLLCDFYLQHSQSVSSGRSSSLSTGMSPTIEYYEALVFGNYANYLFYRGECVDSLQAHHYSIELLEKMGDSVAIAREKMNSACCLFELGRICWLKEWFNGNIGASSTMICSARNQMVQSISAIGTEHSVLIYALFSTASVLNWTGNPQICLKILMISFRECFKLEFMIMLSQTLFNCPRYHVDCSQISKICGFLGLELHDQSHESICAFATKITNQLESVESENLKITLLSNHYKLIARLYWQLGVAEGVPDDFRQVWIDESMPFLKKSLETLVASEFNSFFDGLTSLSIEEISKNLQYSLALFYALAIDIQETFKLVGSSITVNVETLKSRGIELLQD